MIDIIRKMPFGDYARRFGVNASLLKTVHIKSLAHAKAQLDGLLIRESDAFQFGTSFHALLLDGRKDYVVKPDTYPAPAKHAKVKSGEIIEGHPLLWNSRATECDEWEKAHGYATILNSEAAMRIEAMVSAVHLNPDLKGMLKGDTELSVFANRDNVAIKARADLVPENSDVIIDFKTTRDAHPAKFIRQCVDLGYHIQCAWLLDVFKAAKIPKKEVWLVAVESEYPHAVAIVKFADEAPSFLRLGRIHARAAFAKVRDALQSGQWKDYGKVNAEDLAPGWMIPELEKTL